MAFHFKLESVRKLRRSTRDEKRVSLGEAVAGESEILRRIDALRSRLGRLKEERRRAPFTLENLRRYDAFEQKLLAEIRAAETELAEARRDVEVRREALVVADREVKTLDRLEEKQREAYLKKRA
ncbi:MAG: flagellar FliJ family protein [Planctomycetia bacterium]|nr:flagellar FliJ family protein [Planctomycetia bacterium]